MLKCAEAACDRREGSMDKQNDPKGKRVTSRDRKLGADKERAGREKTELSDDDLRQVSGGASSQIPKTKQPV